jgi:hypothetical protein
MKLFQNCRPSSLCNLHHLDEPPYLGGPKAGHRKHGMDTAGR